MKQYKFKRQAPIASYIVDFVSFERKLVIEADGGQHMERIAHDANRTAWLESQGFAVCASGMTTFCGIRMQF